MGRFGYRLYKIRLHKARGHKRVDFGECGDHHYQELACELLSTLQAIAIGDPPIQPRDGDVDDDSPMGRVGQRALRVERYLSYDRVVFGSLYSGKFGEYQLAMAASDDDEDASLEGLAASKSYRFVLGFPDSGEFGILGIETINLTCPVAQFTGWLTATSKAKADEAGVGGETPDGHADPWWYLKAQQMTDFDQLRELVEAGRLSKVDLVQYETSSARTRKRVKMRVTAPYIEGNAAQIVISAVQTWWRQKQAAEEAAPDGPAQMSDDREGAKELRAIFGKDVEHIDFDDGWVLLKDAGDRAKQISPSRMSELFTYPLSYDIPVSDEVFYRKVVDTAQRLARNSSAYVEWPLARDVLS